MLLKTSCPAAPPPQVTSQIRDDRTPRKWRLPPKLWECASHFLWEPQEVAERPKAAPHPVSCVCYRINRPVASEFTEGDTELSVGYQ